MSGKKKSKKSLHSIQHEIIAFVLLALFFISGFLYMKTLAQPSYVPDRESNSFNKVPANIANEVKQTSVSATFRIPILMYHYIEVVQDKHDTLRVALNILPSTLESQIETLKNAGYTFMTAKDLGEVLNGHVPLPNKPVLLTFDDGHRDFYTDVFPIIQKYEIKVTNYVIPGFIGGSDFMTDDQVLQIAKSGLVDVGAHTVHHIALKGASLETDQYEIGESKKILEKLIHKPVVSFAYPYGSFDLQAAKVVQEEGFLTAVSTIPGDEVSQSNRYFLYRIRPGDRTGQRLLDFLQQTTFKLYN